MAATGASFSNHWPCTGVSRRRSRCSEALNRLREGADELLHQQRSTNRPSVAGRRPPTITIFVAHATAVRFPRAGDARLRRSQAHSFRRQPLDLQKRLYRVMAQMAGLIASSVNAVTVSRETHAWFHVARLAAEEAGDRTLRAWVAANEGMSYRVYDRLPQRAVDLARTAGALAGRTPTAAGALAAAIEARALARLGRRDEVRMAVRRSDEVFERLEEQQVRATRRPARASVAVLARQRPVDGGGPPGSSRAPGSSRHPHRRRRHPACTGRGGPG